MNCIRPYRFCIQVSGMALGLMFSSLTNAGTNSTAECDAEIASIVAKAESLQRVANARIELESWKLDQLKSLRKRGFATWLEVARQRLKADTLLCQQAAIKEFASFNRTLQKAVRRSGERSTGRAAAPVTLSLAGSVRLVGWIQPSQIPPEMRELLDEKGASESRTDDAQPR